jgi:hypothetical protein
MRSQGIFNMKNFLILLLLFLSTFAFGQADRAIKSTTVEFKETTTPANPPANSHKIYAKSDGSLYILNSAGTETAIGTGSGGGGISQWITATNYATDDVVIESNLIYICINDHLSGTFATDLAANEWQAIQIQAEKVINVPAGNLAATEVQGAVDELQGDIDTHTTALADSAGLAGSLGDETGTGLAVFGTSPNITTPTGIVKGDVGLGNVDNTSDANKPVSTATQTALDLKQDTLTNSAGLAAALSDETGTGLAVFGTSPNITTPTGIVKGDVGLGNVDNTSDANKPVSTATQTALDTKVSGVASSVDSEIMLFDSTTGKASKRATGTGFVKATSGVYSVGIGNISGKAQNVASVTVEEIQVPNNLLTETDTNKYLSETGNTNILANPSFEHSTFSTSWTNAHTGGNTSTATSESTIVINGLKSYEDLITTATGTSCIYQDSTLYADQFADGVQGIAMVRVKTDEATTICVRQAGVTSTTDCVSANTDDKWGLYKLPFILGATSNGISICTASDTVNSQTYIDDALVGLLNLSTAKGACTTVGCSKVFTASVGDTGTGSPRTINSVNITSWLNSCTRSLTGAYSCNYANLGLTAVPIVTCGAETVSYGCSVGTITTTTVEILTETEGNGTDADRPFSLNVYKQGVDYTRAEANDSLGFFSSQCGANCEDNFSAKGSSAGVTSDENVSSFVTGNAAVSDTSLYTYTISGFTVTPNCGCSSSSSQCTVVTGSTNATTLVLRTKDETGITKTALAHEFWCQKQGVDFIASRTINGTLREVPVVAGVTLPSGPRTAVLNCDAGSAITSQKGTTWVSSIGNISSGACAIVLVTGAFSDSPDCQVSNNEAAMTTGKIISQNVTSATAMTIDCEDDASTACTTHDTTLTCSGAR